MEIRGEDYCVKYEPKTATVSLVGSLRLFGAAGFFSMSEYEKNHASNAPRPATDGGYASITDLFDYIVNQKPACVTVDLRELKHLNSSGINVLSKFIIKLREMRASRVIVHGSNEHPWQARSLRNLQRLLPEMQLALDDASL